MSSLPNHCASLISSAHDTLLKVCEKLSSGDVLVEDLHKMLEHKNQMEKLCSVIVFKTLLKKQDYRSCLACRLNELQSVKLHQDQLKFLCSKLSIPIKGI